MYYYNDRAKSIIKPIKYRLMKYNENKGLENGFFHTWQCGGSAERIKVFKTYYKSDVDAGKFNRFITNAPRDARYKIDYYYNSNTKPEYTVPYPNLDFHGKILKYLNLDETFNWKERLVDVQGEYTFNDFTLGYKEFDYPANEYISDPYKRPYFYFKYKGVYNTLKFSHSPRLVDYSDPFWAKYKGEIDKYDNVSTLLHNIEYFIIYNKIKF